MTYKNLIIALSATLIVGCADTHQLVLDSSHRPPTTSVEVFKDGEHPAKASKPIAELSWKGHGSDELKAQQYLMEHAKKLGGNAIAVTREQTGEHLSFGIFGGMGGATKDIEYLYKARVLVYE
jgi:hypothetical protein